MENILLAVVVGVAVWLFLRNARMMKARRRLAAEPPPEDGTAPEQKSMPRMGTPGTITRQQMALLKENDFEPARVWSEEEAQLILDTVTYLRAVIRMVTGESGAPLTVQNNVLGFILGDDELRESVLEWSLNRTREEEEAGADVALAEDETFARVAQHVRELWEDG